MKRERNKKTDREQAGNAITQVEGFQQRGLFESADLRPVKKRRTLKKEKP